MREQERVQPVQLRQLVEHLGDAGEHHGRGHRPHRHVRQGGGEQADRDEPEHRQGDVEREQQCAGCVRPAVHLRAGQQRHRADPEQHGTDRRSHEHDEQGGGEAEGDRSRGLHQDEPHPAGRRDEQVPQGAVTRLARHGVTRDDADRERQEQRDRHGQRGERHEETVVRDVAEERRAAAVLAGGQSDRDGDQDRHGRQGTEHRPGSAPPEDERELGAEQGEGTGPSRRGGATRGAAGRRRALGGGRGGVSRRHRIPLRSARRTGPRASRRRRRAHGPGRRHGRVPR